MGRLTLKRTISPNNCVDPQANLTAAAQDQSNRHAVCRSSSWCQELARPATWPGPWFAHR